MTTRLRRTILPLAASGVLLCALFAVLHAASQRAWAHGVQPSGAQWFVAPHAGGDCTQPNPCELQTALDLSASGDEILFAQGVYTSAEQAVILVTHAISLYGGWDGAPDGHIVRDAALYTTTLDGENERRIIDDVSGYPLALDGFELTGGNASAAESLSRHGGALAANYTTVQINNCIFRNNVAFTATLAAVDAYGGAVYLLNPIAVSTIANSWFEDNAAAHAPATEGSGGAIYIGGGVSLGVVRIEGNTFRGNTASVGGAGKGGAIAGSGAMRLLEIFANTIEENAACTDAAAACLGGGVYLAYNRTAMVDNLIQGNTANAGAHEGYGGGMLFIETAGSLENNLIQGNRASQSGLGGGGGLRANHSELTLSANRILGNDAGPAANSLGGGLWLETGVYTSVNTIIAGNAAGLWGAGIYTFGAPNRVTDIRLLHNTLAEQSGDALALGNYATAVLTNTIAAGNGMAFRLVGSVSATISATATLFWQNPSEITGALAIFGDPAFADGDYRIALASPARDAGVDAGVLEDFDGQPRDAFPDMGADEWLPVHALQLAPPRSGAAPAGGAITYTHRLTNSGNVTDSYSLSVEITATGWAGEVSPSVVILPPGGSAAISAEIRAPLFATIGDGAAAVIRAASQAHPAASAAVSDWTVVSCPETWELGWVYAPQPALVGQAVWFTATASIAPVDFSWDFGDGGSAAGQTVSHTFALAGDYPVLLSGASVCGLEQAGGVVPAIVLWRIYLPLVER